MGCPLRPRCARPPPPRCGGGQGIVLSGKRRESRCGRIDLHRFSGGSGRAMRGRRGLGGKKLYGPQTPSTPLIPAQAGTQAELAS